MWDPIEKELRLVIEPQISPYRGPLYFARLGEPLTGETVIAQGAFGLVDTGRRKLLITCNHVWKALQEQQREDPNVRLHLCLDLERTRAVIIGGDEAIDRDENLDIAVFDMGPIQSECGGRKFYPLNRNPGPRVAKGDRLALLGNPGVFRSETAQGLEFGLSIYAVEVASVDGLRFQASLSNVKVRSLKAPSRSTEGSPHAGISGNPCFLARPGRPCEFLGFATGHWMEYLFFTHVRCLNPDGTINRDPSQTWANRLGTG
jgi:hypothetical protein